MFLRLLEGFRRINRPPHPEESVALRLATCAAAIVGVVALWNAEIVRPSTAGVGIVAIPLGMTFSWALRKRDNWEVKLVLTFAIMIAFGAFVRSIARLGIASISDTIQPLGELMVWVQVMHSFDLPGRRDLYFSLAAAFSMVAAGAVQALTNGFGLVIAAFGLASLVALYLGHSSELADKVRVDGGTRLLPTKMSHRARGTKRDSPGPLFSTLRSAAALLALVSLVTASTLASFILLPRLRTARVVKLPFSIKGISPVAGDGLRIETPGLEEATGDGGVTRVDGGYFGFANRMDLSVRGRPGDDIVMRVRADRPAFWRGLAYATYDGRFWQADEDPPHKIDSFDNEMVLPSPAGPTLPNKYYDELIQTFYIEAPQANLVFGAYRPTRIYFPAAYVRVDREGSVRSPVEVDRGLVYSVVSRRRTVGVDDLRNGEYGTELPKNELERYLQVPPTLPQRVRDLAVEITKDSTTRYEKVIAIEKWLMQNTQYTLDIPPLPPGRDALDVFLFEDKKGFCEQIATAEVILLRLSGVPARLVSGYLPGQRSFFSGTYEVRGSDAHTWTEIYYPGIGWVESDPTYVIPKADSFSQLREAIGWVRDRFETLPGWIKAPVSKAGRFLRGVWHLEPVPASTAAFVIFSFFATVYWIRQRKKRLAEAALAWEQRMLKKLELAAAKHGVERDPSETFREFALRVWKAASGGVHASSEADKVRYVSDKLERQVYSRYPLDAEDRFRVETILEQLEAELDAVANKS